MIVVNHLSRADSVQASLNKKVRSTSRSFGYLAREFTAFGVSPEIGILALSNNIPDLSDKIKDLRIANDELNKSGKKGPGVWKTLRNSLLSWQTGIIAGVTLLTLYRKEIIGFFNDLFSGSDTLDRVAIKQDIFNKALDSSTYKNGLVNLQLLRTKLELYNEGLISGNSVLNTYNSTLGVLYGKLTDIAQVQGKVNTLSDDYIKQIIHRAKYDAIATRIQSIEAKKQDIIYQNQIDKQKEINDLSEQQLKGEKYSTAITSAQTLEALQNIEDRTFKKYQERLKEDLKDLNREQKFLLEQASKNAKEAIKTFDKTEYEIYEIYKIPDP